MMYVEFMKIFLLAPDLDMMFVEFNKCFLLADSSALTAVRLQCLEPKKIPTF